MFGSHRSNEVVENCKCVRMMLYRHLAVVIVPSQQGFLQDNYDRMCAETKPKKVRKKAKPSAMTRPSKRGKKKRRLQRPPEPPPTGLLDAQAEQQDPCGESLFDYSNVHCS